MARFKKKLFQYIDIVTALACGMIVLFVALGINEFYTVRYDYEEEVFDQYVINVIDNLPKEDADTFLDHLTKFVYFSRSEKANKTTNKDVSDKDSKESIRKSAKDCKISFAPDQIGIVKSLVYYNRYSVVVDKFPDQSDWDKVEQEIVYINCQLNHLKSQSWVTSIRGKYSDDLTGLDLVAQQAQKKELKPQYYSHLRFKQRYRQPLKTEVQIAIYAALVSLFSLVIAFWQGLVTKRHNRISLRPYITFWKGYVEDDFVITLSNVGAGPAIISDISVYVDNLELELGFKEAMLEVLDTLEILVFSTQINVFDKGFAIKEGASIELLVVKQARAYDLSLDEDDFIESVENQLTALEIDVSYMSLYNDSFQERLTSK